MITYILHWLVFGGWESPTNRQTDRKRLAETRGKETGRKRGAETDRRGSFGDTFGGGGGWFVFSAPSRLFTYPRRLKEVHGMVCFYTLFTCRQGGHGGKEGLHALGRQGRARQNGKARQGKAGQSKARRLEPVVACSSKAKKALVVSVSRYTPNLPIDEINTRCYLGNEQRGASSE